MVEAAQSQLQQWLSNDQPIGLVVEMMAVTLDMTGRTLFSSDLSDATLAVRQEINTSVGEVLRQFQSPLVVIWTLVGFPPPRSQAWQQANRYLDETYLWPDGGTTEARGDATGYALPAVADRR